MSDVIIAARGNVSWTPGGQLRNSGNPTSNHAIGLLSTGNITMGQGGGDVALGVAFITAGNVDVGNSISGLDVTIEAAGNVSISRNPQSTGEWAPAIPPRDFADWRSTLVK